VILVSFNNITYTKRKVTL